MSGDGCELLKQAEVIIGPQAGPLLSDLLATAIQRDGTIALRDKGRILVGQQERDARRGL